MVRITDCSNKASAVYCGRTFLRNSQKFQQELLLHSPVQQSMKINRYPNVHDEKDVKTIKVSR